jgi:hypothetical protein
MCYYQALEKNMPRHGMLTDEEKIGKNERSNLLPPWKLDNYLAYATGIGATEWTTISKAVASVPCTIAQPFSLQVWHYILKSICQIRLLPGRSRK